MRKLKTSSWKSGAEAREDLTAWLAEQKLEPEALGKTHGLRLHGDGFELVAWDKLTATERANQPVIFI